MDELTCVSRLYSDCTAQSEAGFDMMMFERTATNALVDVVNQAAIVRQWSSSGSREDGACTMDCYGKGDDVCFR